MKNYLKIIVVFVALFFAASCAQSPELWVPRETDLFPPRLISCERNDERHIVLKFDEALGGLEVDFPEDGGSITDIAPETKALILVGEPRPGEELVLHARVTDASGNSSEFLFSIFGINADLPTLKLNELSIQGSGNHPDYIELYAETSGNLAGLVVTLSPPEDGEAYFVFPSLNVATGEYITLHAKPQGISAEKDELKNKWESGGLDASSNAWDFWWRGGKGLSGTTGIVALLDNPRGRVLDAAVYTNRTSASDEDYLGWGSKSNLEKVQWLAEKLVWNFSEEEAVPEDGIPSGSVTSTRTLNKKGTEKNKEGWFTGSTSSLSPGARNTTEVYKP